MKQIAKPPDTRSKIRITIDEIIMIMGNIAGENHENHKGGKMKIIKRRFSWFTHDSMIASQIEIKA